MIKLIKKIFSSKSATQPEDDSQASIQKLVSFNTLNKRKNLRVKYPHIGAFGPFPKVFYKETEMIVTNISVGGVLIIDDTEKFGQEVGEIIMLQINWPDTTCKIRARIVGANQQRRHLQFVDFNAQAFLRISNLSKPAYLGTRFHKVRDEVGQLQALELWVGPTNETLAFYNEGPFAELTIRGEKLCFKRGSATTSSKHNTIVDVATLWDVVIMLANIPQGSNYIRDLIEIIESEVRAAQQTQRTGTYG